MVQTTTFRAPTNKTGFLTFFTTQRSSVELPCLLLFAHGKDGADPGKRDSMECDGGI